MEIAELKSTREALGDSLLELGAENQDIVVLDADLAKSTCSLKFAQVYPDRFFECGIAEQNMIATAAGLAASGKVAFTGSFAIFAAGRAFDQIRNVVAYGNLNVKMCPTHGGITVGEDGASHQTIEDVSLMRSLPNMRVVVPADYYEAKAAIKKAAVTEGPFFIRLGRPAVPYVFGESYRFELGKAVPLRKGGDVSLLACGIMVNACLQAAESLAAEGIDAEVISLPTIKPLDVEAVLASAEKTRAVVTCEEHSIIGGLGSAVAEILGEYLPTPLTRVGIKDEFGLSGSIPDLLKHYKLTPKDIVDSAKSVMERKK
jgi:transketolase